MASGRDRPPVVTEARLTAPGKYEITPVRESAELTTFATDLTLPPNVATAGHIYRVRVRVEDATDRWSHWLLPEEFITGRQQLAGMRLPGDLQSAKVAESTT